MQTRAIRWESYNNTEIIIDLARKHETRLVNSKKREMNDRYVSLTYEYFQFSFVSFFLSSPGGLNYSVFHASMGMSLAMRSGSDLT